MSENNECIEECCEFPICLKIVDVCITEEAQAKFCAILCNCDDGDNGNGNGDD